MGFIFGAFLILIFSARFIIEVRQGSTGTLGSWNGLEYGTDFEYSFYSGGGFLCFGIVRSCRMKGRRKEKKERLKAVSYKLEVKRIEVRGGRERGREI